MGEWVSVRAEEGGRDREKEEREGGRDFDYVILVQDHNFDIRHSTATNGG